MSIEILNYLEESLGISMSRAKNLGSGQAKKRKRKKKTLTRPGVVHIISAIGRQRQVNH